MAELLAIAPAEFSGDRPGAAGRVRSKRRGQSRTNDASPQTKRSRAGTFGPGKRCGRIKAPARLEKAEAGKSRKRHRRAARQSRHAGCADTGSGPPLPQAVSDRSARDRKEFAVLEVLLLNGLILPIRSRRKARDYRKIWNNEKNESPFKTITRSQAEKLASILEPLGKHVIVDWAMRYGNPSIASRLEALTTWGCDRILVMPLYPQYAAPTTATVCDEVFRFMMRQRRQPALRILPPYYDDPYYIEVLASSLQAELKALPFAPDVIIASYHGMPKDYVAKGDPYEGQCVWTTQLLRQKLGFDETKLMMTFQSRFGRGQMARAVHDQHGEIARQEGREESGHADAGIFRRLPGDAGRDRGRERARVQALWRAEFRGDPLPQRQRGRHADDLAACDARAQGLGYDAGRLAGLVDLVCAWRLSCLRSRRCGRAGSRSGSALPRCWSGSSPRWRAGRGRRRCWSSSALPRFWSRPGAVTSGKPEGWVAAGAPSDRRSTSH